MYNNPMLQANLTKFKAHNSLLSFCCVPVVKITMAIMGDSYFHNRKTTETQQAVVCFKFGQIGL